MGWSGREGEGTKVWRLKGDGRVRQVRLRCCFSRFFHRRRRCCSAVDVSFNAAGKSADLGEKFVAAQMLIRDLSQ